MTGISFAPKFTISPYVAPALISKRTSFTIDEEFTMLYDAASKYYGKDGEYLLNGGRTQECTRIRHLAMWHFNIRRGMSLQSVATMMNRKDHTTTLHAIGRVREAFNGFDNDFLHDIHQIMSIFEEEKALKEL